MKTSYYFIYIFLTLTLAAFAYTYNAYAAYVPDTNSTVLEEVGVNENLSVTDLSKSAQSNITYDNETLSKYENFDLTECNTVLLGNNWIFADKIQDLNKRLKRDQTTIIALFISQIVTALVFFFATKNEGKE